MQPVAADGVAWSVCLFVCWSCSLALLKWLIRSKCRLGADLCRLKEPCIRWGQSPPQKGAVLGGGFVRPIEKHRKSLLRAQRQKNQYWHQCNCCSPLHCYRLAIVTLTFSPVKIRPPLMWPLVKVLCCFLNSQLEFLEMIL